MTTKTKKAEPKPPTQFEVNSREAIRANTILELIDARERCATWLEREAINARLRVLQAPECD